MQGQQPTQAPTWSGGGVLTSVRKPPVKRPLPPARRPPDLLSKAKFHPPKDLKKHLDKLKPISPNPFNHPKSKMLYGVRVDYGQLFPYYNDELITAIEPLTRTAGFIDIRPFKGYIDIGFASSQQADISTNILIPYKDKTEPVTRTQYWKQTILAIQLTDLTNHLPFKALHRKLLKGLKNYGDHPTIVFNVPKGIEHLAGPTEMATVKPYIRLNPKTIPIWTVVPSAPNTPFRAFFEGAQKGCTKCHDPSHSYESCPAPQASNQLDYIVSIHATMWGTRAVAMKSAPEEPMDEGQMEHPCHQELNLANHQIWTQSIQHTCLNATQTNLYSAEHPSSFVTGDHGLHSLYSKEHVLSNPSDSNVPQIPINWAEATTVCS
ncbi:hypothetical protein DSO57_1007261 [Entomophthora muscae]|uniref:Uncharacterized protein n=1 Tax=Entomophthora muscae TaxID=34485 RepID=A0ACC2UHL9_9FUNG|nr:hypothetical protein DSO57_1007261 [Entomophthora muscae]